MNKVVLIGNLTRDPELSQTGSGISRCTFALAVNRNFTNAQGEREVDFINIIAWRGIAETCARYLKKGNKCCVAGSLQVRNYEVDGQKRTAFEVVAEDVEFLTPKNSDSSANSSTQTKSNVLTPMEDDNLPF